MCDLSQALLGASMNPSMASRLVDDHQRELERMATRRVSRGRRRSSISRSLGLALMRAGRRLAGPDELVDRRPRSLMLTNPKSS